MWPDFCLFFFFLNVRCSILNCEVVLELLSSKLQDPSNTIKMVTMVKINLRSRFSL